MVAKNLCHPIEEFSKQLQVMGIWAAAIISMLHSSESRCISKSSFTMFPIFQNLIVKLIPGVMHEGCTHQTTGPPWTAQVYPNGWLL